ncbi:hypothetical protein ACJ4V0_15870 [Phreatobacter sp. HK31-P]
MRRGGNSKGTRVATVVNEMCAYDRLPSEVRTAVRDAVFAVSSLDAMEWLATGLAPDIVARAVKISDADRTGLAAFVTYGSDHPAAHPAPTPSLLREYGFIEAAARLEINRTRRTP